MLPAHVTRAIQPSPARAEPHDAATWFPVPDPTGLPTIDALLAATIVGEPDRAIDLVALEALVTLTPARAEPHDASAWLPLPADLRHVPDAGTLRDPAPEVQAAVVAESEAILAAAAAALEATVAPSPARAEPHDATTWLPLPDPDTLVPMAELTPSGDDGAGRTHGWRRVAAAARRPRVIVLAVLLCATVVALVRPLGGESSTPAVAAAAAPFGVTVDLDGTVTPVETTARSAKVLARELKVGKLVAVRTAPDRLRAGSSVVLRTRRSGLMEVDGQLLSYDSPSHTVAELLAAYDVSLEGEDTTVPDPSSVLADGARVTVVRVGAATRQTEEPIAFGEEEVADPTIPIGERRELRPGRDGVAIVTWRARIENGVEVGQVMLSKVPSVAPEPRLVGYGTRADWHWDALANCESGGRWGTVDGGTPSYDGGLGILRENWVHYGGLVFAPNAGLASREQQIQIAEKIRAQYGWEPWGCATGALGWA